METLTRSQHKPVRTGGEEQIPVISSPNTRRQTLDKPYFSYYIYLFIDDLSTLNSYYYGVQKHSKDKDFQGYYNENNRVKVMWK